ncbi:hypothetical protein MPSEU_000282700 [Mayamaea pseudoterrestris]|nr:hypothetical protein MPSEU_000282700 [Mayamaea pseudoterrestris]
MLAGWARVLQLFVHQHQAIASPITVGFTRSSPLAVLVFCVVRATVELIVAPMLTPSCNSDAHLWTAVCWSLGDAIRFFCFFVDAIVPGGTVFKRVRYAVGPLVFPLGATGEMIMVAKLAHQRKWYGLYLVAALWPVGFYPLYKSLLANRRKFFDRLDDKIKTS